MLQNFGIIKSIKAKPEANTQTKTNTKTINSSGKENPQLKKEAGTKWSVHQPQQSFARTRGYKRVAKMKKEKESKWPHSLTELQNSALYKGA